MTQTSFPTGALLLAIGVGLASAANAADVYAPPAEAAYVPPAEVFSWDGLYFGINGGGAWGSVEWDFKTFATTADHSTSGGLAGGTVGFNIQTGSMLVGIEGDLDWANISGSTTCPNANYSCNTNIGWLGTLRARLGFAADRFLFFATGGLAAGGVNAGVVYLLPGVDPFAGTSTTTTDFGWTAGLGGEVAFGTKWSAKLEWLYYDLGAHDHVVDNGASGLATVRETGNLVRVGLNRRF